MQVEEYPVQCPGRGSPFDRVRKVLVATYKGANLLSILLFQESFKFCELHIPAARVPLTSL